MLWNAMRLINTENNKADAEMYLPFVMEGEFRMKLIAKAIKGKEFFHSRKDAAFAPDSSANKICKIMNDERFRLNNKNEVWHVYDYDFSMKDYVLYRLSIYKGIVKMKSL